MLLATAGNLSAESYLHCKYKQLQVNDELYQRFVEGCQRIYFACIAYRETTLGESRESAREACNFPIKMAPEFSGPCPELLYELESPKYDDVDSVVARVNLREWFMEERKEATHRFYKQQDSMKVVRSLLEREPNNLLAINYEYFHRHRFESEEDVVALTKSAVKMHELDPNCSIGWSYNPDEMVNLLQDLVELRKVQNSTVASLTKPEYTKLVHLAFETMKNTYENVYRISENIRKLDYAKKLIEHPFMFLNEGLAKELGSVLNINPEEYMDTRRRLITDELIDLYVVDPIIDERQSLGMICNDYAFEIGLAKQCLVLIEKSVQHYDLVQRSLPAWVWEAAMSLAITASRACNISTNEEEGIFRYLHCTFCFYAMECGIEEGAHINKQILELFDHRRKHGDKFEYYLLKSYALTNEESVRSFRRSIELSNVSVLHSLLLAKRLKNKGYRSAAISLLDTALEQMRELNVSAVVLVDHDYLGSETCNSSFRLNRNTRDLRNYVSEVEEMRKLLSEGKTYDFYEFGHCGLRWDN